MLELWKSAYGDDRVLMDYEDPPVNPCANYLLDAVRWNKLRPHVFPENLNVIHGHFKPNKYDLLRDVFRFTMLRHPVENLISIYCYWKKIKPQPNVVHRYFLGQNLDIIGLARLSIMQNLYNDTYFGGWDMGLLDFIGRHENRTEDLKQLGRILNVKLDTKLHLNATEPGGIDPVRCEIESNFKIMNQLEDLLSADIRFYEKYTS